MDIYLEQTQSNYQEAIRRLTAETPKEVDRCPACIPIARSPAHTNMGKCDPIRVQCMAVGEHVIHAGILEGDESYIHSGDGTVISWRYAKD